MSETVRISAKNLGELALPDCCPRCFWLKLKLRHRLPFQIFPGIFSSIDSYNKKVVHAWFDELGRAPGWLAQLGDIVDYKEPPHYSKFNTLIDQFDILLTGSPDAVLVKADGSNVIVDYKTAKYTGTQDKLFPMYEAQLNAYAYIGERCGLSPISGVALLYMEPVTDVDAKVALEHVSEQGFGLDFKANLHPVDLWPELILPFLARCREIADLAQPPESVVGCKNCQLLEEIATAMKF